MTPIGSYPTTFDLVPQELFNLNPVLLGRVGSRAYGTEMPDSDSDYMGICIAPPDCYVGLNHWHNDGTKEYKREGDGFDSVSYELKKFLNLCLNFNPNVIPLLWLRPEDYVLLEPEGQALIDNRKLFNSKRAYHTFLGYAKGQIHRMKVGSTGKLGTQRKALVEKYGYDTKFAYHTIRLLRMVNEFFLSDGEKLGVFRNHDAEELKNIRTGSMLLEDFYRYCEDLMEEVTYNMKPSTVPENPDFESINDLCMFLIKAHNRL